LKTAEHGQLNNVEGRHLSASLSGCVRCLTRMPPSAVLERRSAQAPQHGDRD
jgi:hypothetical protein